MRASTDLDGGYSPADDTCAALLKGTSAHPARQLLGEATLVSGRKEVRAIQKSWLHAHSVSAKCDFRSGRAGHVTSLAHPGGNFTGISYSETMIGSKRLEFLLDAVPFARRVAIIWDNGFPENAAIVNAVETAARARSLLVLSRKVIELHDLTAAFDDAARFGAAELIFLTDNLLFGCVPSIAEWSSIRTRCGPSQLGHEFLA